MNAEHASWILGNVAPYLFVAELVGQFQRLNSLHSCLLGNVTKICFSFARYGDSCCAPTNRNLGKGKN